MHCNTIQARSGTGHSPRSSPGFRHMRRQRHCSSGKQGLPRTHGGTTHGSSYPPQHPRAGSGGHTATAWVMIIAYVVAGGTGRGHETCSFQRNGATRNRPASRCTSDAPPPGAGTCYCGASSMASASRLSRWWSRRPSRAHRPHDSHSPSTHSSGGSYGSYEPGDQGGVRPALDPALREDGL